MRFNLLISRQFSTLIQTHISSSLDIKIKALVQQGHYQEALKASTKASNFSKFTFPSLLKACASLENLRYGKTLHSEIIKTGLIFDPYITASLINMYVKCGSLCIAVKLFENVSHCEVLVQDVTLWNSMIDGFLKNGYFEEGVVQFRRMQVSNVKPDGYTLCILLGVCNGISNFSYGRKIHGYVVRNIFDDDPFVITALIDMYSNFNRPVDAWNVFEKVENNCNIAVWNAMINGFGKKGFWRDAFELYSMVKFKGLELGSTSFSTVLTACSQGEDIDCGRQLHCDVIKAGFESDPYVSTSLLTLYSKCGFVEDAEKLFHSIAGKEVGMWNSMISAYVNCECPHSAVEVYYQMRFRAITPDSFTISNVLIACSMIGSIEFGRMIHGELWKRPIKDNVSVQSALLTMYSRFGRLEDAFELFVKMKEKDIVTWGSMISGNCENRKFKEALDLFKAMKSDGVELDPNVIASAINACVELNDTKLGCCIHGFTIKKGLESDVFTGSSLIELYSKCGQPEKAGNVFSDVSNKNLVVWNSLISCYCQNGIPDVSISLFPQILQNGLYPDSVSITSVLSAVSSVAALLKGKAVHSYYIRLQIPEDIQVENALLNMYLKCGFLKHAQHLFQIMSKRNVITWNSMIAGYGSHGEIHKAIKLFDEMRNSGTVPDEVTFLSLISSCNHAGFTDVGLHLFHLMREHRLEPKMEHHINIVDLLGRAGRLEDALSFIQNMFIAPDRGIWLSLLSACRIHHNVELGELAADNLLKLEPTRGSNYVQLLNLYVEVGLLEKAANLRALMRQKGLTKVPGCSWIELKNKVDVFYSEDSSCPSAVEIYDTLDRLKNNMKKVKLYSEAGEALQESG
ncbi:pentatricopeptide repeat-containing protein At2g40720-like [Olea europaea var. sylvestris]|uniref:pentatricopeptide repeat-containing protein At2g40720-like n=1 Tax=Olea europaea var. sylvestris TaxID=158386 RepID=UPI000C1D44D2|nr:pentatricopeptide repeat-containing protein At2g40720-like [Olea europaea var. sylvestris]